ncbi:hypothetical protein VZ95_07665 [Elstera litoralis]|uniref:gamma-glutamyl-gamma-aminobutyrate hydrolase n=1 Tax=Elstera litoralis TaxID=552518 RepID=A0A0F3ITX7_9PROT|nr:gamma-glutamyl-gamma-aminobutyrate hydrolase family protein [Elstera litoralis]KJV10023.1 hypothetical protein VZ95_07665 [Elstera litoralis]
MAQRRVTSPVPRPPLIGVTACIRTVDGSRTHTVGEKYIRGVTEGLGGLPLLIPALGDDLDIGSVVGCLDGLLITGSLSNVEPHLYGGEPSADGTLHDPARDATVMPLMLTALTAGIPLLAICRGHQELNVVLGGTLHQRVHEQPGRLDHRAPETTDLDIQYGPSHAVTLTEGGLFQQLNGGERRLTVNSLHWQAIDRLADGLEVEAVADDGTIEGVRVTRTESFAASVQWHPEFKVRENPFSLALFGAFGDAARAYAGTRRRT